MRRIFLLALAAALMLGLLIPTPTLAAIGDPEQRPGDYCFFLPDGRAVGDCTDADLAMYMIRQQLTHLQSQGRSGVSFEGRYHELHGDARRLLLANGPKLLPAGMRLTGEGKQTLHISLENEYLVRDAKSVGQNIRYASIQFGNNQPAFIVLDELNRPLKLYRGICETKGGWWAHNVLFPILGSYVGGFWSAKGAMVIGKAFTVTMTTGQVALMERTVQTFLFVTSVNMDTPAVGQCEYLVDVLNTPGLNGDQYVYRGRVLVDADGVIDPKPWTGVFNQETGSGYWKQFGPVSYDEGGRPVW